MWVRILRKRALSGIMPALENREARINGIFFVHKWPQLTVARCVTSRWSYQLAQIAAGQRMMQESAKSIQITAV